MRYRFNCKNCNRSTDIVASYEDIKNSSIVCSKCGSPMQRDWKAGMYTRDNDRAENLEETSWLRERMNYSPTGKSKVLY